MAPAHRVAAPIRYRAPGTRRSLPVRVFTIASRADGPAWRPPTLVMINTPSHRPSAENAPPIPNPYRDVLRTVTEDSVAVSVILTQRKPGTVPQEAGNVATRPACPPGSVVAPISP